MKNFLKRFLLTLLLLVLLFWLKTAWAGADGVFPWFDPITTLLQVLLALLAGTQAIERVASSLYPNTLPLSVEHGRVLFYGVPVTALSFWNKVRYYFLFRWLSESRNIHYITAMQGISYEGKEQTLSPFPDPALLHRQLSTYVPTQYRPHQDEKLRLRPERALLNTLLANPEQGRRTLVLAEAGMGKSTLLARVMQDYLRTRFWRHLSEKKAIFWVPLQSFDEHFCEKNFTQNNLRPNECILLLDALDEDASVYTDKTARWAEINRLCAPFYKVIVTTRTELTLGSEPLDTQNWSLVQLQGFAPRQQKKYLSSRLRSLVGVVKGTRLAYRAGLPVLKRSTKGLFARPFLLATLVDLIKDGENRARYEYDCEVLDDLIDKWLEAEAQKELGLKRRELETFVTDLACDMTGLIRSGSDLLSEEEKERLRKGYISDNDLKRRAQNNNLVPALFAHCLLARSGNEVGVLVFAHQIVRDYLAARQLFGQISTVGNLDIQFPAVWHLYNQLCWARLMSETGRADAFGLLNEPNTLERWLKKQCQWSGVPQCVEMDKNLLPLRAFLLNLPPEDLKPCLREHSKAKAQHLLPLVLRKYIKCWAENAAKSNPLRFGTDPIKAEEELLGYLTAWALLPYQPHAAPNEEAMNALLSISDLKYSLLARQRSGSLSFKHPLLEQAFLAYCCEMGHSLALDTLRPSSLLWAGPFRTQLFEKVTCEELKYLKGELLRENGHFAGREWVIKENDEQYDYAQPPLLGALGLQEVPNLEALESARAFYLSAEGAKETVRLPWVLGFCDQLETLILRECGDLHTLDQLGLALEENELPETLRVLCLWGTGIKNLKGIDLLKTLDTLQVCGSKLSEIPQLSGLPHLKWIRLTHGEITEVPYDLQDHLPQTTQLLDLSGNALQVDGPLAPDGQTPDYWAWQVDWGKVLQRQFGHPVRLLYLLPDTPYWADIPDGTLRFGDEPEGADERELLAKGAFKMSRFLLTVAQFHAFVQHQHYVQPEITYYGEKGSHIIDLNQKRYVFRKDIGYLHNEYGDLLKPYEYERPVLHVSWHDAQACAQWYHARLPSEAEWEYAAKANTRYPYAGGEDLDALGWFTANSAGHAQPVGQKAPNGFGLFDLSGNAWEWCEDRWPKFLGQYASETGLAKDSSGSYRVRRGGSWDDYPRSCRASNRNVDRTNDRYFSLGFRLARTR